MMQKAAPDAISQCRTLAPATGGKNSSASEEHRGKPPAGVTLRD